MEIESPSQGQAHGLGFWHPAMRPDSHQLIDPKHKRGSQVEDTLWDSEEAPSRHTSRETPVHSAELELSPPLQVPLYSDGNPSETRHLTTAENQEAGQAPNDAAHAEDEGHRRLGGDSGNPPVKSFFGLVQQNDTDSMDDIRFLEYTPSKNDNGGGFSTKFPDKAGADFSNMGRAQVGSAWHSKETYKGLEEDNNFNRTNSFPEVPPLHQVKSSRPRTLSSSQAELIMEEDEKEMLENDTARSALPSVRRNQGNILERSQDECDIDIDQDREDFFATSGGSHRIAPVSPAYEEARFEEGLPLMASTSHEEWSAADTNQSGGEVLSSSTWPDTDDGGFFGKDPQSPKDDSSYFKPQPLDRKTTTQVLDSLHYPTQSVTHDQLELVGDRPSQADVTEGDLIEYSNMEKPEAFAEKRGESISGPASSSTIELSGEAELAAMWQAALGDDELLMDEVSVDPSSFFEDDGEGFLEEVGDQRMEEAPSSDSLPPNTEPLNGKDDNLQKFRPQSSDLQSPGPVSQSQYLPASSQSQINPSLASFPSQAITGAFHPSPHIPARVTQSFAMPSAYEVPPGQQYSSIAPPASRPRIPEQAQSFSNKSKGGYTSPYDLPMDITRPKKRTQLPQMQTSTDVRAHAPPLAPPRSSSMYSGEIPPSGDPRSPVSNIPQEKISPPVSDSRSRSANHVISSQSSLGSFFEELPSSKARPSSGRRPTASATEQHQLPQLPIEREPLRQSSFSQRPSSSTSGNSQGYQLLPPERMGPYAHSSQPQSTGQAPVMNSRYSPAPAPQTNVPPSRTRYASSPSGGHRPPPPSQGFSFQPRTSSPLAQSNTLSEQHQRIPDNGILHNYNNEQSPPLQNSQEPSYKKIGNSDFEPPRRSQTQSPNATRPKQHFPAHVQEPYQRPASTNYQPVPSHPEPNPIVPRQGLTHARSFSQRFNYVSPSDGRENDPLERWKGYPVFRFGFGGTIASSFPKQIPRYSAGQTTPMIKCSPGEVKINGSRNAVPLEESISSFPGPLKAKSKKKELLEWLQKRISLLQSIQIPIANGSTLPDLLKHHEEKCLLWKTLHLLVEHDGIIEGNLAAISAIRSLLSPESSPGENSSRSSYNSNQGLIGISRYEGSRKASDPADPEAMEALRKILLRGEREAAVWYAVDQRLWAQAMLLASTLDAKVWKQVVQEFVRQEVKAFGRNTESVACLYQILAGNWEESIDELVPPSARAGLQMVSKGGGTEPTKNALDGLDRWRETLTLILSNRSQDDWRALVTLGRLLSSYGRTEAAHICFIFAKAPGLFGGADDPQVIVALLGADHVQNPFEYNRDFDSILLTEVYDFVYTVLAPSTVTTFSPHLQSYKLYHAMILADYGYRSEAQQYCDSITAVLKSTTKLSPYFHGLLFGALEDLIERLRQAPTDASGSWMSRPSMDKVSGSVWTRLNQFIAGDESDNSSAASGKGLDHDVSGPFGRVAGGSPTLSRRESLSDLYSGYPNGNLATGPVVGVNPSNSRYAPAGQYTPRSLQEQARTRSSLEPRQESLGEGLKPVVPHQPSSLDNTYPPPTTETYVHPSYNPDVPDNTYEPPTTETYVPPSYNPEVPDNIYEPSTTETYVPPSYNPDVPDGDESPVEEKPKKRSFMDDDDDEGFTSRAAALLKADKAKKDREAEEAFRRAAEEDAKKAPPPNAKKSWFGGWLGGKKNGDALNQPQSHGPIRAKLGEESSFFYDEKLKKWVNKKGGTPPTVEASKPPPPKGPPSRAVSSAAAAPLSVGTPPVPPLPNAYTPPVNPQVLDTPPINMSQPTLSSTPPSPTRSVSSAAALPGATPREEPVTSALMARTPSLSGGSPLVGGSLLAGESPSGPPSAPPSRPATGMSNASSIDDLLGAPQARKGGTVRKGKKGRGYVDVMAK